jgi:hypothetical protein
MADQQSADALHLIARTKRIPQIVLCDVEARHSQRDREAGCGQRPSESKAVVGRRAVHTQPWHIRASKWGVGTALRPPEDERLRNRVSDNTANKRGTAVLENSPITWRDEHPLHFGSGREGVRNSTAVLGRLRQLVMEPGATGLRHSMTATTMAIIVDIGMCRRMPA